MSARLTDALRETAARTDALLDRFLAYPSDSRAAKLYEACRYSSLDGGKRIRPFVAAAFADALGAALPLVWLGRAAAARPCPTGSPPQ